MTRTYNRREFLKVMGYSAAAASTVQLLTPSFLSSLAFAQSAPTVKRLLWIYLSGGIDMTGFLFPNLTELRNARPTTAPTVTGMTPTAKLLTTIGGMDYFLINQGDTFFRRMWDANQLTFVSGIGVPGNQSQSHDVGTMNVASGAYTSKSTENIPIEQRLAALNVSTFTDPLAYVDLSGAGTLYKPNGTFKGISGNLNSYSYPNRWSSENRFVQGTFLSSNLPVGSSQQQELTANWQITDQKIAAIQSALRGTTFSPAFPNTGFGNQCKQAFVAFTQLGCRVAGVERGGFDTHATMVRDLGAGMTEVNDALNALQLNLARVGMWDDGSTAIVAASEFGRNIQENSTQGFDHGLANTTFVASASVRSSNVIGGGVTFTPAAVASRRNAWATSYSYTKLYEECAIAMGLNTAGAFPDLPPSATPIGVFR